MAVGDDVDLDALRDLSRLTGGSVYQAATPKDIPGLLAQSMFNRG